MRWLILATILSTGATERCFRSLGAMALNTGNFIKIKGNNDQR